jgi:Na+-translocating ferredoxin:NAD+ oxidoreductase subunit B
MPDENQISRRNFLKNGLWASCAAGLAGMLAFKKRAVGSVWQLDPYKCTACGKCEHACVLEHSAVKCVQAYALCGYCDLCSAYFEPKVKDLTTAAENQLCPTGAIKRTFVEDPYFEYTIDESLCTACGKCVKGCVDFGNGSLFLQIRHDRCLNCNECSIAVACPAQAFKRVSAAEPYLVKNVRHA